MPRQDLDAEGPGGPLLHDHNHVYSFARAARTKYQSPGPFTTAFVVSQLWTPDAWDDGVGRVGSLRDCGGIRVSSSSLRGLPTTAGGPWLGEASLRSCFMLTSPGCVSVSKLLLFARTRVLSDLGPTVPQENLTLITSA